MRGVVLALAAAVVAVRRRGGPCPARNHGDAVVRYGQIAGRPLITMPIVSRIPR